MNLEKMGRDIVESLGGADNIKTISHCATRLRVTLKDDTAFDKEKAKSINGVMGLSQFDDQHQLIIGPGVANLYKTILREHDLSAIVGEEQVSKAKKNPLSLLLEAISGSIAPVVPAITAAGFIKVILAILSMLGIATADSQTYQIFDFIASAVFYFMPLFVAYTLAEKLNCDRIIAVALVAVLLYPDFVNLLGLGNVKLFGFIPVASASYNGSIVPALLTVYVLSLVEKWVDKVCPTVVISLVKPIVSMVVTGALMVTVLAPLGYYIGYAFVWLYSTFYEKAGWLCILILAIASPFLGMTGMHLAMFPLAVNILSTVGYECVVLNLFFVSTISQGIAALAVFFKTKKLQLKEIAGPAAFTTLVGSVGEPSLFAVNARLRKPLYATMIGTSVAGVLAVLLGLKAFTFGAYSVFTIPAYINPEYPSNVTYAIIVAIVDIIVTFAATWIIGFDDSDFE